MKITWAGTSWKSLLVRGVLAVLFGILAMVWPLSTLLALVLLWGTWALLDGIALIGDAFSSGSFFLRASAALLGLLGIAAALLAFTRPGITAVTITWVLGIWLVARGGVEAVVAVVTPQLGGARWPLLLGAALDLLLGILLFANPGRAAFALVVGLGLVAVLWGLAIIATALMLRRELGPDGHLTEPPGAAPHTTSR